MSSFINFPESAQSFWNDHTSMKKNPSEELKVNEVFLSFRGKDTRASFTSHLHASLQNGGIKVYIDDRALPKGDYIPESLKKTIKESRISVIVFSKNYAESSWCMDELLQIMECHKTIGQVVLPVFYNVDPSEIRHQAGEFGKVFQNHLTKISEREHKRLLVEKSYKLWFRQHLEGMWRPALRTVASHAGFVVLNSKNESEAIKDIVENIIRLLDKTDLFIANNPVGVESRVRDMIQLLDMQQSNDVVVEIFYIYD